VIQAPRVELPDNHIRTVFEVTDRDGRFPVTGGLGRTGHIYEPGVETSLCGHMDESAENRSLAREASHDRSLVNDQRICEHCSTSVRKFVREERLTTGHRELDAALRTESGDQITVTTPDESYSVTVESTTEFEYGNVKISGCVERDTPEDIEHWTDAVTVYVYPDGCIEVQPPYDLTKGSEQSKTTGSLTTDEHSATIFDE